MIDAFGVEVSKSFVPRSGLVARAGHNLDMGDRFRPSRVSNVTAIKATVLKEKQPILFNRQLRKLKQTKETRDLKARGKYIARNTMNPPAYTSVYAIRGPSMDAETYKKLLKYRPSQAVRKPRKKISGQDRLF